MTKRIRLILVCMFFLPLLTGCLFAVRYEGNHHGRVIDAETGKPLQGVVVLGVWYKEHVTVAGGVSEFSDAHETVTDKNGDFELPGKGVTISDMHILIFKTRYEHVSATWENFGDTLMAERIGWKIRMEKGRAIIPLRKLTMEERRNRFGDYYVEIPENKQRLLLHEIEKEEKEIGR